MQLENEKTERTYRYERWRALASGILETASTTFLLLIAVRWFRAGATAKALIAGGVSFGYLLGPLIVSMVARLGWTTAKAASRIAAAGAGCFLLMALFPVLPIYVLGSIAGMAATSAAIPLLTQIYQENYPNEIRGHLFARTFMIRIGTAALFSEIAGRMLSEHLQHFQIVLWIFAGALGLTSLWLDRYPSQRLTADGGTHPLRSLRFAREDALFRRTLICWMLMGFANLMMIPMRVEYLANPRYHLGLKIGQVAVLTGVIPNLARLVMSPIWGWLFDRINFFALRIVLNLGFAFGILAFFTSSDRAGLVVGAILFGISTAGGDVAWSLWVTKLARAELVADYMSVHTFFTGVRGVIAPLVAFHASQVLGIHALGWIAVVLIVASTALLLPELRFVRALGPARPAALDN